MGAATGKYPTELCPHRSYPQLGDCPRVEFFCGGVVSESSSVAQLVHPSLSSVDPVDGNRALDLAAALSFPKVQPRVNS